MSKKRRQFSNEFKNDAVRLVKESGQGIPQVAENIGVLEVSLRSWVKQAVIDNGKEPEGACTTSEKAEITRLKKDLKLVTMERDFLKKAAAFFARESENSK